MFRLIETTKAAGFIHVNNQVDTDVSFCFLIDERRSIKETAFSITMEVMGQLSPKKASVERSREEMMLAFFFTVLFGALIDIFAGKANICLYD